jgi:hypothetical protein
MVLGLSHYSRQQTANVCCNSIKFTQKSVNHHTIQANQPTRSNSFTSLLLDVYVWFNMFRASPRPSSGAYNCTRSLWFYRWRKAVGALLVVFCRLLTFMCSSICLGRLRAHHQEHTTVLGASGFTVREKWLERCWSCSADY